MNDKTFTEEFLGAPPPQKEETTHSSLDTLVGDGRKYRSADDLAKGYVHADMHIHTLEEELRDARARLNAQKEIIDGLRLSNTEPRGNEDLSQNRERNTSYQNIDPESIKRDVLSAVEQKEQQQRMMRIQEESINKLVKEYGGKQAAADVVNKVVEQNPTLRITIDNLARTDSDAFVKLLKAYESGVVGPPGPTATPGSNERPSADALVASRGELTAEQARELRRKDPQLYHSPEFREKLEISVAKSMERGIDFWSGKPLSEANQ